MTALATLAAVVLALVAGVTRAAWKARTAAPTGQYWFAQVPFEDGTGSKDRPVLVLAVRAGSVKVLALTSQNQSARAGYVKVDTSEWGNAGRRASWLRTDRVVTLPPTAMRRYLGQASGRTWAQVLPRHALLLATVSRPRG